MKAKYLSRLACLFIHKLTHWSDTTIARAFPDFAPLQTDRKTNTATARRPSGQKTDKGDGHTSCSSVTHNCTRQLTIYMCVNQKERLCKSSVLCVSNTSSQCVYSLLALSQTVCVCVCVTGDAKPSPHTVGNIWDGFPRNVLACLWNALPPSLPPLLPSLAVAPLSSLRRGEGEWENGGTHKFDPCFVRGDGTQMQTKPQSTYKHT